MKQPLGLREVLGPVRNISCSNLDSGGDSRTAQKTPNRALGRMAHGKLPLDQEFCGELPLIADSLPFLTM